MPQAPVYNQPQTIPGSEGRHNESCHSGVMWGAIIGGALATAVIVVLLFSLASALGFAAVSPWGNTPPAIGKSFAISGALALIVIQWVSAGFGGYLTGRLRTQYVGAHTHEVFFRDTVHGFLSWALATVLGALLLTSAVLHMHNPQSGFGKRDYAHTPAMHFVDRLFATPKHDAVLSDQDRAEATNALDMAAVNGSLSPEDKNELVQLVAARTDLSVPDSEHRVEEVLTQEKTAIDGMRKYAAAASLFLFFSMMIGAFIASVAGALGGQHRDLHYTTGRLTE